MSIDELNKCITEIGVGANVRDIAHRKSMLQAAVNLGVISNNEIKKELDKCNIVLNELDCSKGATFVDFGGTGGSPWKQYVNIGCADAKIMESIVKEMYREDGTFQLLLLKKQLGIKAVAQYKYGKLQGLFVYFSGRMGKSIKEDMWTVSGVPENIGEVSSNTIRVYGTLTIDIDKIEKHRYGKEKDLAIYIIEQLEKENLGCLRFVAEYIDGKDINLSDRLDWANNNGFSIADYCLVDADIYEYDDYLGEKSIEMFDYSNENEVLDSILVMINNVEKTKLALMSLDEHFNENVVAIRIIDSGEKEVISTKINQVKLVGKNGVYTPVILVDHVSTKQGLDIDEVEVTVDKLYELEDAENVTLEVVGSNIKVIKEA